MNDDRRIYGSFNAQSYEKLKSDDTERLHTDDLATLEVLKEQVEPPLALSPETDSWECTTTLCCCALNAFVLAFDIMAFIPVIKAFESDFDFNVVQV